MIRKLVIASVVFMSVWLYLDLRGKVFGGRMMIVDNPGETNILTIRKSMDDGEVTGLSVYLFGEIDGTAALSFSDEKQSLRSYTVGPGKVSLKSGGDWYADKCSIAYQPAGVREGHLTLRYRFTVSKKRNG